MNDLGQKYTQSIHYYMAVKSKVCEMVKIQIKKEEKWVKVYIKFK